MMRSLVLVLLLFLLPLASNASKRPPKFTFDYAKSPGTRWDGALKLATQGKSWDETWGQIFSHHNSSLFDYVTPEMYTQMGDALKKHYPTQAAELQGIAAQFAELFPDQVVTYEYLAGWVYYHEIAHSDVDAPAASEESKSCAGLLAADKDGFVHHVANMDQSPPEIRDVTIHVEFINSANAATNDDVVLFEGVDWYWFTTGTSRMVKKGVASFQENWRTDQTIPISDLMVDIANGVPAQIFVFRNALEAAVKDPTLDFERLVQQMATICLASPYYVIMAGPNKMQGAVIARSNTGVAAPDSRILRLGESDGNPTTLAIDPQLTTWAIAQTNHDHWEADPETDPRRIMAENTLTSFGQEEAASNLGLYAVASTYPVHNPTTAYTAVMDSRTGEFYPFVRVAMCPVGDPECQDSNKQAFGKQGGSSDSLFSGSSSSFTVSNVIITVLILLIIILAVKICVTKKRQDGKEIGSSRAQYDSVP